MTRRIATAEVPGAGTLEEPFLLLGSLDDPCNLPKANIVANKKQQGRTWCLWVVRSCADDPNDSRRPKGRRMGESFW